MLFLRKDRGVFAIVLLVPPVIDLRSLRRHGRIDDNGQHRYASLRLKLADHIKDLLRSSNRKSRDQDRTASLSGLIYYFRESGLRVDIAVQPVAIRGFTH